MSKHPCLTTLVFLLAVSAALFPPPAPAAEQPAEITIYVSPNGDDAWSGRLASPNAARTDGPVATLERARDLVRETRRAAGRSLKATVLVRGGTYYITRTFRLGPEDSGTKDSPVVYRAFRDERPILVGGQPVGGWRPYRGKILKADLAAQGWRKPRFRQLFFGGQRQILARRPNFDPANPYGGGFSYVEAVVEAGSKRKFRYAAGAVGDWAHPREAEVFIFPRYNWNNNIVPIAEIDKKHRVITLQRNVSYDIRAGDRYYIRNVFEELDSPGEWYLDRQKGILYFWPPEKIGEKTVTAPVVDTVVEIRGDGRKGRYAQYITLRGLTIECCDGTGVVVRDARHCEVAGCTVRNCGATGISISGGSDSGAFGNDVYQVGSTGISVSGGDRATLAPARNYATNNYVHHVGVFRKSVAGIGLGGVGNIVSHNLIHDSPRWGIIFGGNDHVIEYNHVRHVNLETCDTGGIYICARDWTQRGTVIRYNIFHDILGYGRQNGRWVSPYYAWGIYIDDWSSGLKIYGNITYRTPYGGIHIHGGRDNLIENNIFIEGTHHQVKYQAIPKSRASSHGSRERMLGLVRKFHYTKYPGLLNMKEPTRMANNRFFRNIIYYSKPDSILYWLAGYDFETCESDYNTIFHFGRPLLVTLKGVAKEKQWARWRAMGFDRHSIVADPLFVNPAKDDYRLRPESPAFKLGFKPIPVEKIGPFADPRRASWPIVEAEGAREKPLAPKK